MDVNKLTQKTQEAIQNAQNIAARLQQVELDVEHVLMALLEQADGLIPRILAKMDIPVDTVVSEVHKLSLIHISEPTRLLSTSYAVFCLKKKNQP